VGEILGLDRECAHAVGDFFSGVGEFGSVRAEFVGSSGEVAAADGEFVGGGGEFFGADGEFAALGREAEGGRGKSRAGDEGIFAGRRVTERDREESVGRGEEFAVRGDASLFMITESGQAERPPCNPPQPRPAIFLRPFPDDIAAETVEAGEGDG
jgi:hypothetical protein